jgi:N6-adenosine-specific RNA methylase IME4
MEQICALPIKSIMDKKAAAFVWATGPRLHLAIDAIREWGLYYRGVLYVWVKCRKDGTIISGQGVPPTFTKPTTEFLLAATTNKTGRPFSLESFNQPQVVIEPRDKIHSKKPDVFRNMIVDLCGDISRIELFARERFENWSAWGNEV